MCWSNDLFPIEIFLRLKSVLFVVMFIITQYVFMKLPPIPILFRCENEENKKKKMKVWIGRCSNRDKKLLLTEQVFWADAFDLIFWKMHNHCLGKCFLHKHDSLMKSFFILQISLTRSISNISFKPFVVIDITFITIISL